MRALVDNIIAPYFDKTKVELKLASTQSSIWKIDCWSVHKSQEFLGWMKKAHPTIIIIFVPGGCTGMFQPLDVSIQRVMKLSMKLTAILSTKFLPRWTRVHHIVSRLIQHSEPCEIALWVGSSTLYVI
jgi:hypothetical protein